MFFLILQLYKFSGIYGKSKMHIFRTVFSEHVANSQQFSPWPRRPLCLQQEHQGDEHSISKVLVSLCWAGGPSSHFTSNFFFVI